MGRASQAASPQAAGGQAEVAAVFLDHEVGRRLGGAEEGMQALVDAEVFRDAVLDLSEQYAFARPLVNSGRLSLPCTYDGSPLNTPDALNGPARTRPGAPCPDAPLRNGFLLDELGDHFVLLAIDTDAPENPTLGGLPLKTLRIAKTDDATALRDRYLGTAISGLYLIRPDQHVAARWPDYDETAVIAALKRATAQDPTT